MQLFRNTHLWVALGGIVIFNVIPVKTGIQIPPNH